MTPRERVLTALDHLTPDRAPRDFWAEVPTWNRLFAHVGHEDKSWLLDDLGIDVRHLELDGPSETPEQLKAEFGERLCFHGGIDMRRLLPHGSADEVRKEVRRYCDVLGRDGEYILGPAHLFQPDVPPENILSVYQGD